MADWIFNPSELANYVYLNQQTNFSFSHMMYIIIHNCSISIESYISSIFFGLGGISYILINMGDSGITSRANEIVCGDPFFFKVNMSSWIF